MLAFSRGVDSQTAMFLSCVLRARFTHDNCGLHGGCRRNWAIRLSS